MTVTSRVRHIIELDTDRGPLVFEVESRDIGHTQGTTIRHGKDVLVRYRPRTRHLNEALQIAEQALIKAAQRALKNGRPWKIVHLAGELETVLAEGRRMPWDGKDLNDDNEEW